MTVAVALSVLAGLMLVAVTSAMAVSVPLVVGVTVMVTVAVAPPAHDVHIITFAYNGEPGVVEIKTDGTVGAFDPGNNSNTQAFTDLAGISYSVGS